jgi:FSR family fosmidomycin resistance protein-like MFS transporter
MRLSKAFIFYITVAWLGHFMVDLMIGIWPIYKTMARLDLAVAGLIGGFCAFAGEGMQVVFGSLGDKGYRKSLILAGIVGTTASSWFVYSDNYVAVFFLYLVTCIGSGAFHPSAAAILGDIGSTLGNKQGLLIGLFTSGGSLGMALSQILYGKAHIWFNGQVHWLSVPAILLVLAACLVRVKLKSDSGQTARPQVGWKTMWNLFKQREFCLLYICQVSISTLLWGTMFLLPDVLLSREYEPWLALGWGHMVYMLSAAVMMVPAGFLADRYSSRAVILAASLISAVCYYLFLFQPYLENGTVLMLLFGAGAALGVVNPVSIALGTRLAPNHKGAVSAFLMGLVWCVSEGIGQGLGGYLATLFSEDAPAKSLSIMGSLFIAATITAYLLPRKEEALEALETI